MSAAGTLALAVVVGFILVALTVGGLAKRRRTRLAVAVREARLGPSNATRLSTLAWDAWEAGALRPEQLQPLRDCRTAEQVKQLVTGLAPDPVRVAEMHLAEARSKQVRSAAGLSVSAMNAGGFALDGALSQVGNCTEAGIFVPGAALAAWRTHQALSAVEQHAPLVEHAIHSLAATAHAAGSATLEHVGAHLLQSHVPLVTVGRVVWQEFRLVEQGKSVDRALKDGALDIVGRGGGAVLGAKAGAVAGGVLPGAGHLLGAVAGAVLGGMFGGAAATNIKQRPLREALQTLEAVAQRALPVPASQVRAHLTAVAAAPGAMCHSAATALSRTRVETRWRSFWPSFGDVLHAHLIDVGFEQAKRRRQVPTTLTNCDATRLAIILLNSPVEAAELGVTEPALRSVAEAQQAAAAQRELLYAGAR